MVVDEVWVVVGGLMCSGWGIGWWWWEELWSGGGRRSYGVVRWGGVMGGGGRSYG